jgi:uncharacterized membrane protein
VLNLGFFAAWCVVNVGLVPGVPRIDPFPFGLLALLVSAEAVALALFILINQRLLLKQSELRSHLNLQIALLAEKESTRILRMVQLIARKHGIPADEPEDVHLTRDTRVEEVADTLRRTLDGSRTG